MESHLIEQPDEAAISSVREVLRAYNRPRFENLDHREFIIRVDDETGGLAGGIYFSTHGRWLEVDYLIVAEGLRRTGLGSRLLTEAEELARQRGCRMSLLSTFSFQARPFYEKHGYRVVYEQVGMPVTSSKSFLEKQL